MKIRVKSMYTGHYDEDLILVHSPGKSKKYYFLVYDDGFLILSGSDEKDARTNLYEDHFFYPEEIELNKAENLPQALKLELKNNITNYRRALSKAKKLMLLIS